jgi:hypothetical protein
LSLYPGLSRVGRNEANDIQIEHTSVSSFHCEITCAGESVIIKDLSSTNGTFIEGSPILQACLAHNQRLQLGSVEMILDASATAPGPVKTASVVVPPMAPAPSKPLLSIRHEQSDAPASVPQDAASPAVPSTPPLKNPYQIERPKAEAEAKSKIFWGDAPDEVLKYLMRQGINVDEASNLVATLLQRRALAIRRAGIRKNVIGLLLMCVPVASYFIFMAVIGGLPLKFFAATVAVGLWGVWMFLKGTIMFLSPKSEPGDVADK